MSIAIKAENISKAYQIGEFSTGTISRDIERWWALMRGKEDPFLRIGETNDRSSKGESDIVWSLKDINFNIEQGDAVGIIGRNGAGKSTLLKILSRVTTPTTGSVKVKGRIASLLEVGTGFHPELTGKENIYLNGAILGMRKHEIKKHFDAIVDFAGVERYVDTPVKRYSSGMYVRLAFAVAAHLQSEILIVDEVLAVGDAEFQKKCLGKMGDVSQNEGRTVLFVSHNMGAVNQLCKKGILLKNGQLAYSDTAEKTVREYLRSEVGNGMIPSKSIIGTFTDKITFKRLSINGILDSQPSIKPSEKIDIKIEGACLESMSAFRVNLSLYIDGVRIFTAHDAPTPYSIETGVFEKHIIIPAYLLRPGEYLISIGGHCAGYENSSLDWIFASEVFSFNVIEEWSPNNDFNGAGVINLPQI